MKSLLLKRESEDDEWFIEKTKHIPLPTKKLKGDERYDHRQMSRLFSNKTLRSLYHKEIYDPPILKYILEQIKSEPLKELFINLYFIDGKDKIEVTD